MEEMRSAAALTIVTFCTVTCFLSSVVSLSAKTIATAGIFLYVTFTLPLCGLLFVGSTGRGESFLAKL